MTARVDVFSRLDASKYAVTGATKSLAIEYAAAGIRFNAVCPGPDKTSLLPTFLGKVSVRPSCGRVAYGLTALSAEP